MSRKNEIIMIAYFVSCALYFAGPGMSLSIPSTTRQM